MPIGEEKKKKTPGWVIGAVLFALLIIFLLFVRNANSVNRWLGNMLLLFRPVIIGLVFAYLCNPLFRLFERKIFSRVRPKPLRRALSMTVAYLVLLLTVAVLVLMILPQLLDSLTSFANNYDVYFSSAIAGINDFFRWINEFAERFTSNPDFLDYLDEAELSESIRDLFGGNNSDVFDYLFSHIGSLQKILSDTLSVMLDILFGLFVSIYFLVTKELRYAQVMKFRRAMFSDEVNRKITEFCTVTDRSFGNFMVGKIFDSLIIGVLTFVLVSIFRIPYALLIAAVIAVANIIPVIGPIIGAIPTALILLLSAPEKFIPFIIIILLIQQLDSNVIAPKILGRSSDISSLCVLIAITIMNALWGLIGALLAVPLFATVLMLLETFSARKLQEKGLPTGVDHYYAPDSVVDPVMDTSPRNERFLQKLERVFLTTEKLKEEDPSYVPDRKQRFYLSLYRIARGLRTLSEPSEKTLTHFAAQTAAENARKRAETDAKSELLFARNDDGKGD